MCTITCDDDDILPCRGYKRPMCREVLWQWTKGQPLPLGLSLLKRKCLTIQTFEQQTWYICWTNFTFFYNWNYLCGNSFLLLCCGKGCRLAYPPSRTLGSQLVLIIIMKAFVVSLLSIIALKIIFIFVELNIPNVHIW